MARIRTIKPEFWSDSKTGTLSGDATKLFMGMLNFSDDYGVLENDIVALKAKIFPYRSEAPGELVGRVLVEELFPKGLVIVMSVNQRGYLWIRNFEKHQRVDKPGDPLIPGFTRKEAEESIQNDAFGERSQNIQRTFALEGKGKEGKGKEKTVSLIGLQPTKPSPMPEELAKVLPTLKRVKLDDPATLFEVWKAAFPDVGIVRQILACDAWAVSKKVTRTPKGWARTLNTWLGKEQDRAPAKTSTSQKTGGIPMAKDVLQRLGM